ncbi:MAG: hypothetical protein CME64_16590 [Halobacteriovoraceae bacterium]|nr:hypothetical protein [Halobacteriovoraceae bacterium]
MRNLNDLGQTMVEYILLLAVVSVITVSLFKSLEDSLVSGPNSLINSYLGEFNQMFQGGSYNGQYKRFTIKR